MIDTKRAMTGSTLTIHKSHDTDLKKPFDIVDQLLASKDLDYTSDEKEADKGNQESVEDLSDIDTGALEIEAEPLEDEEELPEDEDIHDGTPSAVVETDPLLSIPSAANEE